MNGFAAYLDHFAPSRDRFGANRDHFAPNLDRFGTYRDHFAPYLNRYGTVAGGKVGIATAYAVMTAR